MVDGRACGRRLLAQRLCFKPFADYIDYWKHTGYWLFNSPREITELANAASISLEGLKLFYYEAYELQFDEDEKAWEAFESWSPTEVVAPISKKLEGFDIVSFTMGNIGCCSKPRRPSPG